MLSFPTKSKESRMDQDATKHPMESDDTPRSTVWMGGPGKEATSADAWHMTANRMIPLPCHDQEQTMGGCPKAQGTLQITFDHGMNTRYTIGAIARKKGQHSCPLVIL